MCRKEGGGRLDSGNGGGCHENWTGNGVHCIIYYSKFAIMTVCFGAGGCVREGDLDFMRLVSLQQNGWIRLMRTKGCRRRRPTTTTRWWPMPTIDTKKSQDQELSED